MNPIDLTYALAKYVPDMERGFTIATSYGDLRIEAEDAAPFVALAKALLEWQYRATGAEELEGVGDLEEEDEPASQDLSPETLLVAQRWWGGGMSGIDKESAAPQMLALILHKTINGDSAKRQRIKSLMPQGDELHRCLLLLQQAEKLVLACVVKQLAAHVAATETITAIQNARGTK